VVILVLEALVCCLSGSRSPRIVCIGGFVVWNREALVYCPTRSNYGDDEWSSRPPMRTVPPKVVKTERTHEENQEQVYIAASRRSDRSLEARLESAKRAPDIYKQRTGRSICVAEEDVINEEITEEDDDLQCSISVSQHISRPPWQTSTGG
jgi:hypothetical protein